MLTHRAPGRSRRSRGGFTLVELLVALVVFDIALLAFAADAAVLVRLAGVSARRDAGVVAAQNRLAELRAAGCPAPGSGAHTPFPGVHERWSVGAQGSAARRVRDSVYYDDQSAPLAFVLHTTMVC